MKRIPKGVSFNIDDPFESMLLDFSLKQGPFSKYVKRLIQRDMEGKTYTLFRPTTTPELHSKASEQIGIADSFI